MDKNLFETLQAIEDSNGILKIAGYSDQDHLDFENLTLKVRELDKMGLVNFDESKGKTSINGRNHKSQYLGFQCKIEYPGKKVLSFGTFEEYQKSINTIEGGDTKLLKIFISHSELDVDIAEKMVEYLISALEVQDHEIRCSSVPGHKLQFGKISEIIKKDISNNPVIILIITPKSLKSKWVMFELGASWVKELTIIPIVSPNLTYKAIPGPLGEHTTIELSKPNSDSRLSDLITQISNEKSLKIKPGSKQDHYKSRLIQKFAELYPLKTTIQSFDDIDYKILTCIFRQRALNAKANAKIIAKHINATPEIVYAHLQKMHNEQLVSYLTEDGLDMDTNFHLSPPALILIRNRFDIFEELLMDT